MAAGGINQEMFAPSVMAGIIKAGDIVGYRSAQVYIRNSMHTPLNPEAVRDVMPTLSDLLKNEKEAWIKAVLGHFLFTFIHPYMDGNGRMGRFLMNVMLASGGYRWTVIQKEVRDQYMSALERGLRRCIQGSRESVTNICQHSNGQVFRETSANSQHFFQTSSREYN